MEQPDSRSSESFVDIPNGKIVSVQTFLEMNERAPLRPEAPRLQASLRRVGDDVDGYLALFHRVGDEYLWFSRLTMRRDDVTALLNDSEYEAYAVASAGEDRGIVELDFRAAGECELRYFGLVESAVGTGLGRFAMNRAIERAWARPIGRFWVHTCTLDHPSALAFYRRSGFVPYCRKLEIADDPRLTGVVPREAAPNVPILEP